MGSGSIKYVKDFQVFINIQIVKRKWMINQEYCDKSVALIIYWMKATKFQNSKRGPEF